MPRRRFAAAALLASALALAGCLGQGDPAEPLDRGDGAEVVGSLAERVSALVGELPCVAEVGAGTSTNVAEVARSPLDLNGAVSPGELWIHQPTGMTYVARYGTGGFSIVDLADPLAPTELSAWDPEDGSGDRALDVKTTPDGTALLVGGDSGIRIVDVRDPLAPALEHFEPLDAQAHMLTVFAVDADGDGPGEEEAYVAAAKGDGEDLPIWRITGEPGAHALERVASPQVALLTQLTGRWAPHDLLRTHDAFFYADPQAGPTLWLAVPWEGIVALDVTDPAAPREVARIPNLKPQYTHTVQTQVVPGDGELAGRRLTVSVAELGANTMKVYDTTDLASPVLLAEWSVPNAAQPQHNLQIVWPYLYVAHYAEGVFIFDLAAVAMGAEASPIARLASDGAPRDVDPSQSLVSQLALFAGTWDVVLRDGLVYATDGALRVASFGCLGPGDEGMTSTG